MQSPVFQIVFETPEGRKTAGCRADQFIWDAALQAGFELPAICHQGRCLTCACRLIEGEVDQSASVSYFPQDREAGFVLICTARPRTDVVVSTGRQWEMREYRKAHALPAPYS